MSVPFWIGRRIERHHLASDLTNEDGAGPAHGFSALTHSPQLHGAHDKSLRSDGFSRPGEHTAAAGQGKDSAEAAPGARVPDQTKPASLSTDLNENEGRSRVRRHLTKGIACRDRHRLILFAR